MSRTLNNSCYIICAIDFMLSVPYFILISRDILFNGATYTHFFADGT